MMRSIILLPIILGLPHLAATAIAGHGPRGLHPITDRYVIVADSSIDAVLVVDGQSGGAVVGHVKLHEDAVDDDIDKWLHPLSVSTCEDCKHIFVTSAYMLYAVALDIPLSEMAASHDFSSLQKAAVRPFWPQKFITKWTQDGGIRSVSVAQDGSSAYFAHVTGGIFSFDPFNPSPANSDGAHHVIELDDADIGAGISGLHHTRTLRNLVVTRDRTVHIVKIKDEQGNNPLNAGYPVAYELQLDYHCDYLYSDDDSVTMNFVDTVIINTYAFVMGHPTHSDMAMHNGMAIYRLTWDEDDESWHSCVQVAGDGLLDAGWIDGIGRDSRFSNTARDMAVLPHDTAHVLIVADVDNRALRYVDVTVPVEEAQDDDDVVGKGLEVRVSTVAYNEDLYQVLYSKDEPWIDLTVESVMNQDGKSYYHSGPESLVMMTEQDAQDECSRVGLGRVCTLPEIRARFTRGQYPTTDGDDTQWTTVWTNEGCESCHLQEPGSCPVGSPDDESHWGSTVRMIANFSPRMGLQTQCIESTEVVNTFSMCCGIGGPGVTNANKNSIMSEEQKKQTGISFGIIIPMLLIAIAAYGVYMRKKAKPTWWPKFLRRDMKEDTTGHAPHREVDLRGRDYI